MAPFFFFFSWLSHNYSVHCDVSERHKITCVCLVLNLCFCIFLLTWHKMSCVRLVWCSVPNNGTTESPHLLNDLHLLYPDKKQHQMVTIKFISSRKLSLSAMPKSEINFALACSLLIKYFWLEHLNIICIRFQLWNSLNLDCGFRVQTFYESANRALHGRQGSAEPRR